LSRPRPEDFGDASPETVSAFAQPEYWHAGPITANFTFDIYGRDSVHFHVTLFAPIDVRPLRQATKRMFGGFKRCDCIYFGGPINDAGELGVVHIEIEVPFMPVSALRAFTIRLLRHIYLQHCGSPFRNEPREGMAPIRN